MRGLRWLAVVAIMVAAARVRCACPAPAVGLRFATFNIENFPKHGRQIAGAFDEIAALAADFVAVQEIGEPELFARHAQRRLGASWRFVSADTRPIGERRRGHHIGVLFDSARWTLVDTRVHDGTRLGARHKPTFEVRLRRGDLVVRALVVHLKSGSDGRGVRARQLTALAPIIGDARGSRERVVVLGDFNATEPGDRDDLANLARATHLAWATEPLACSAFWNRDDGCPRSRLDHVLTWRRPASVRAAGACAVDGCEWQASCPLWAAQVSDHCPVVVSY